MTRLQLSPGVLDAIKSTSRIASQPAAAANRTRILVLTMGLRVLVPGPSSSKNKSANHLHRVTGVVTAGMNTLAYLTQNNRHLQLHSIPSHQRTTMIGRRRTIITCLNHKGRLSPANPSPEYTTTLLQV